MPPGQAPTQPQTPQQPPQQVSPPPTTPPTPQAAEQPQQSPQQPMPAQFSPHSSKKKPLVIGLVIFLVFIILAGGAFALTTLNKKDEPSTPTANSTASTSQSEASGSSTEDGVNDTERQTDIKALHGQMEAYYAQEGYYPTLANLNDNAWLNDKMPGLDPAALKDPTGSKSTLAAKSTKNQYSYTVLPNGCDNTKVKCTEYVLSATMSDGTAFTKRSLNN